MFKFFIHLFLMINLFLFSGCQSAVDESDDNVTNNVAPVITDFEATVSESESNGYEIGTIDLTNGDYNSTSFVIFSGIYDSNGSEIENITIQNYLLNKENLLKPSEFDITQNGVLFITDADNIVYTNQKKYEFYVVAENDIGTSQLKTITINVSKSGRLILEAATYANLGSFLSADADKIIVFFDRPITQNTIPLDPSNGFQSNGSGKIGSNSDTYIDIYRAGDINYNIIEMRDGGTQNTPFEDNDTIKKTTTGFLDENGFPSLDNSPYVSVEKFNLTSLVKTGNDTCIKIEGSGDDLNISTIACSDDEAIKSDGALDFDVNRSFDERPDVIVDNITLLEWQKIDDNTTRTFEQAKSYCENLALEDKTNWRVPSMQELESIIDRDAQIFTGFSFSNNNGLYYWSSNEFANQDTNASAWFMDFDDGVTRIQSTSEKLYIRCVRNIKE